MPVVLAVFHFLDQLFSAAGLCFDAEGTVMLQLASYTATPETIISCKISAAAALLLSLSSLSATAASLSSSACCFSLASSLSALTWAVVRRLFVPTFKMLANIPLDVVVNKEMLVS